jgi:hypothetical protein
MMQTFIVKWDFGRINEALISSLLYTYFRENNLPIANLSVKEVEMEDTDGNR